MTLGDYQMNISRNFLLVGTLYILVGMGFGMHMGASGDHTFAPLHAHINLVGFVLSVLFALVYRSYPAMAETGMAKIHFWLHQIGSLVLVTMLFLLLSGKITEAGMAPIAPISELLLVAGTLLFAWNAFKNAT